MKLFEQSQGLDTALHKNVTLKAGTVSHTYPEWYRGLVAHNSDSACAQLLPCRHPYVETVMLRSSAAMFISSRRVNKVHDLGQFDDLIYISRDVRAHSNAALFL